MKDGNIIHLLEKVATLLLKILLEICDQENSNLR